MNPYASFAPSPRRKRGLILTLAGSLLFHGSLIGVAALWPTAPAPRPFGTTEIGYEALEMPGPSLPPSVLPDQPDPVAPVLNAPEPVDNPPPAIEPDADSMTLATPALPPVTRTSLHPVTVPRAGATHAASSLSTGGPSSGAAGISGPARPGAGVRWVKPKPVYPPSLRLAHVQGSGSVRVTTDGSGRVVNATVVQSTGNALLDDNTCRAARSDWSGPPNSTLVVPITYHLD